MRCFGCFLLMSLALPVAAADLNLLVGQQFNRDLEIAESAPDTIPGRPGDSVELDDAGAFTLGLDIPLAGEPDARLGAMLTYSSSEFGGNAGLADDSLDVTHLHFTGTRYYFRDNWEPFVMAGIGAAFFSPGDASLDSNTRLSGHIAGGTNYRLGRNLLVRLEARWLATFFNSAVEGICSGGCAVAFESEVYSQFQLNIGLQFRF